MVYTFGARAVLQDANTMPIPGVTHMRFTTHDPVTFLGVQLYHGAMHHCHGAVFEEWGMGNNGTNMGYLVHPVAWADLTAPQRTWGAGGAAAAAATAYASGESQTSKAVCDWVGGDWDSVLPQTFSQRLPSPGRETGLPPGQRCLLRHCVRVGSPLLPRCPSP